MPERFMASHARMKRQSRCPLRAVLGGFALDLQCRYWMPCSAWILRISTRARIHYERNISENSLLHQSIYPELRKHPGPVFLGRGQAYSE